MGSKPISWLDWLRYGPFLVQLVVTRRCNLSCGYCSEYDTTSQPISLAILQQRMEKLRQLRTWTVALMGGEKMPRLFTTNDYLDIGTNLGS